MHGLEFAGVALVILFYIVRAIYRGLRWLFLGLRRALGVAPSAPARPAVQPPQPVRPVQPLQPAVPPRLPPVLPIPPPVSPQQQMQPLPARTATVPQPPAVPERTASDRITLRPDGTELVRALIWQEILGPPRSQRPRRLR